MRVGLLQPELIEPYDRFLLKHGSTLLSYSSKYKDFLRKLLGCEEHYLLAMDGTGIHGVLPLMYTEVAEGRVYNSLPYYGANVGIIADDAEAYGSLVDAYNELASHKTTLSSTIVGNPFEQQDATDLQHNFTDYRIGQFTDIACQGDPWDEIMARVDASARRNVRKATSSMRMR